MKLINKLISCLVLVALFVSLASFVVKPNNNVIVQQEKWTAPKSADEIKNPLHNDVKSTAQGKKLFSQLCAVCHGPKGKGDGIAGAGLTPKPTNLADEEVQLQSDGAMFWKITEGRAPMASYKEILPEKQRWQLINYIKTLK